MRIVTLDPATTEIVSYLSDDIVGVSEDSDYPEEVKNKPKVTKKLINIDNSMPSEEIDRIVTEHIKQRKPLHKALWEKIYELKPDIIIGQALCEVCAVPSITNKEDNKEETPKHFRLTPKLEIYNPTTFLDIPKEIKRIAKTIGKENKAEQIQQNFQTELEKSKDIAKGTKTVVIEWIKPIHLIGKWVSDMISYMGTKSLTRPAGQGGKYDWETIKEFNPDYLIISPCSFSVDRTLKEIDKITSLPGFEDLSATKNKNVYVVEPLYARASQRTLEFLKAMKQIYTEQKIYKKYGIKLLE
ncbi:ABC transporter substrate-binding protein [Acidianus manzaensis]|uniref:Fe/B12 periplasmic-binding domain-containing protein n=1 Tax=Acidianus manzaensis TaxID=282676 RepID=A0A1W6K288_9CREN|nr:ABC transporter substrate-binding protein [Acidianus manzaensis]ARM76615.1 hypothetical protein B6F84_11700 [Acidianus manzaensis]